MTEAGPEATLLPSESPSLRLVLKTLALAALVAALLLVFFVLPAEYDIDPTGVGQLLGIRGIGDQKLAGEEIDAAPAGTSVSAAEEPRTESFEIGVAAGEEMEFKLVMREGEMMVFSWHSLGDTGDPVPLYSDLHADPFGGFEGEDIRYREDPSISTSHGAINAPFAGNHGWYWRNEGDAAAVVSLRLHGFFGAAKELRADSPR